jgi:hypothetical protein
VTVKINNSETEKLLEQLCATTGMTPEKLIAEGLRYISTQQPRPVAENVPEQIQQHRREAIRRMQELYASLPPGNEPDFRIEDMYDEHGLPA